MALPIKQPSSAKIAPPTTPGVKRTTTLARETTVSELLAVNKESLEALKAIGRETNPYPSRTPPASDRTTPNSKYDRPKNRPTKNPFEEGFDKGSRERNKEDSNKLKQFFKNITGKFTKTLDRNSDNIKTAVLGPFSLLISPFEEFFGGDVWDTMKEGFSKVFGIFGIKKKNKKKPTESDVAKNGELGILFLWNKIKSKFEEGKEKTGSFLSGIFGNMGSAIKGMLPMLLKGGAIAAIIGSLVWAIADGIKGLKLADEWGTSKISGFIGGFLGGTEKGWKGAFKNAGKWALMGVGAGFLIAGPIGAIVGGLIGGAIGGILGFIGGENIAKGLDKLWKWAKGQITAIWAVLKDPVMDFINFFKDVFSIFEDFFGTTFTDLKSLLKGEISIETFFTNLVSNVFATIGKLWDSFWQVNPIGKWIQKYIVNPVIDFFQSIGDFFGFIGSMSVGDMIKMVASGGFDKGLATYRDKKEKERYDKTMYDSKEYKAWYDSAREGLRGVSEEKKKAMFLASDKGKAFKDWYADTHVDDAIIRTDGTIIRTHPDDTIIATKNDPSLNGFNVGTGNSDIPGLNFEDGESGTSFGTSSVEKKLDTMISLLSSILKKEPVEINFPKQTRTELDLLVSGMIV